MDQAGSFFCHYGSPVNVGSPGSTDQKWFRLNLCVACVIAEPLQVNFVLSSSKCENKSNWIAPCTLVWGSRIPLFKLGKNPERGAAATIYCCVEQRKTPRLPKTVRKNLIIWNMGFGQKLFPINLYYSQKCIIWNLFLSKSVPLRLHETKAPRLSINRNYLEGYQRIDLSVSYWEGSFSLFFDHRFSRTWSVSIRDAIFGRIPPF